MKHANSVGTHLVSCSKELLGTGAVDLGVHTLLSTASALQHYEEDQFAKCRALGGLFGKICLFTVFIRTELRIFYCENIEITAAWGAFAVKYLLGRTGNVSNDKEMVGASG